MTPYSWGCCKFASKHFVQTGEFLKHMGRGFYLRQNDQVEAAFQVVLWKHALHVP